MKWYCHTDAPLSLHGTINSRFERMPAQACDVSDRMRPMYQRSPGARLRFVTDASTLQIELTYAQKPVYGANLSLIAASSADCYCGSGQQARFLGLCSPASIDQMQAQATIVTQLTAPALVTVALPSRAPLTQVRIGVNDLAQMLPPPPYTYPAPVLFYGSSITEGFCASRPSMSYAALVCRWLDADWRNLGFAGAARGEMPVARYIAAQKLGAFVLDYDHNAPDAEHLLATHEPFFRIVRDADPELPILMMSRPDVDLNPQDSARRRDIVRRTYDHARAQGDRHVWFLDGHTLFDGPNRSFLTIDGCHPTDLGFYRMAQAVYPILSQMLALGHNQPE